MTVEELIEELQHKHQQAEVEIRIVNDSNTVYLKEADGKVLISGFYNNEQGGNY